MELGGLNKFRVWQLYRRHQLRERISKYVFILSIVKKVAVNLAHSRSDSMTKIPCRLIAHAKRAFNLQRRYAFLGFGHEVDREKPLGQWKMCVVKNRTASYLKLITAGVTVVLRTLRDCRNALTLTARTHNTFRPAQARQLRPAFFVASELRNKFWKIQVGLEGFGRFPFHSYA